MGELINLRDAPALCLNTDWTVLIELTGSADEALKALDAQDPPVNVYYRRKLIDEGRARPEDKKSEDIYSLAEKMREDFRSLGASGNITGHGFLALSGEEKKIPPALWRELTFRYSENMAEGNGWNYTQVTIGVGSNVRLQALVAFLRERHSLNPDEGKKSLTTQARVHFGQQFSVRDFDNAYGQVYNRARGRPRLTNK